MEPKVNQDAVQKLYYAAPAYLRIVGERGDGVLYHRLPARIDTSVKNVACEQGSYTRSRVCPVQIQGFFTNYDAV